MIRLTTLGALDLRREDGTEVHSVLRQPKRLALLAFLALARPHGFHRRDRIVALFWPELDQEHSRHALTQAVFFLRRSLGRGVVVNRGDEEIGLGADVVWCDAVAFDSALDGGRLEEALALYRGELLAGFHLDGASEFERWLEAERRQRAQRAGDAAWALAERADGAGQIAEAREWAERAFALAPLDERGVRRLMKLLDAAGDRAGAIAAYQDFVRRVRADLDIEPSAETRDLAQTIREREEPNAEVAPAPALLGLQPAAASAPLATESGPAPVRASPTGVAAGGGRMRRRLAEVAGGFGREVRWSTVLLVVLIASLFPFLGSRPAATMRVAVLPVRDESPDAQYGHITDALTSALIQLMHHPGSLHVVSEFGVRGFKNGTPTRQDIVSQFDVGYIVSGVLTGSDERIKVTIELIDAETGSMIDRRVVEKAGSDWLAFSEQVGADLATLLRERLGAVYLEREWKAGTNSYEAWDAVVRANALVKRALESERPPHYSGSMNLLAEADSLLRAAHEHDGRWSEPLAMLARATERHALYTLYDAEAQDDDRAALFDTAEAYANEALERSRGKAASWELRGTLRHRRFLIAPPSGDSARVLLRAAEADLREALRIDPTRARAASTLSTVLYNEGRLEDALYFGEIAFDNDAYLTEIDNVANHLFNVAFHLGRDDKAARWCGEVERRMPDAFPYAVCALTQLSWAKDAGRDARHSLHLLETYGAEAPQQDRDLFYPCMVALAAPAVARDTTMGADSARAMLAHARMLPAGYHRQSCSEFDAAALVAIGDEAEARNTLRKLVRENPTRRPRLESSRFFAGLFADGSEWLDRGVH